MLRPGTLALTVLLASLTAIGPLSTDMYLPSLPEIARLLETSPGHVQLTLSSYLVGFAVGQTLYGPLSDRLGRKSILLAAVALFLLASLVCALSTSIEMLIAARFAQAFGGSGAVVVVRAIVRDLYSGARAARELSVMGAITALAPITAPLIGGLLQTFAGWRFVFVVLLAFAAMQLLLMWRLLPETLRTPAAEPFSVRSLLRDYRILIGESTFLAHLGLAALSYAGLFAWLSGASFVLQDLYGLSALAFAAAFTIGSAGYLIGTSFAARFVTRLGIDRTIGIGTAALCLGGLAMLLALGLGLTSWLALVLPVAIYLAGLGLVLPQSMAGALQPFPHRAGTASSLMGLVQQGLAAALGALVGHLLGQTAWPVAVAIAACGAGALLLWGLTRGIRARPMAHN
jgi:DHA1 family bicyclomycin/chloramphenicol resistance-like MFS transporter